jgi:hypothetical protein
METIHRVGTFFILVGLALMVMFVGSIMSRETNAIYLFLSFVALFVAFMLRRNKPVNDSGRFSIFRRANERRHQQVQHKNNKQATKPGSAGGIFGAFHRKSRHNRRQREDGTNEEQEK